MEQEIERLQDKIEALEIELRDKSKDLNKKLDERYDQIVEEGLDAYIDPQYNELTNELRELEDRLQPEITKLYKELDDLLERDGKEPEVKDDEIQAQINDLTKQYREAIARRREYKDIGDYDREAKEASICSDLIEKIQKLKDEQEKKSEKDEQKKKNEKDKKQNNEKEDKKNEGKGNKVYDWHPELTPEQKDELIAEGIVPGDPEYFLSLRNYGIKDDGPLHYDNNKSDNNKSDNNKSDNNKSDNNKRNNNKRNNNRKTDNSKKSDKRPDGIPYVDFREVPNPDKDGIAQIPQETSAHQPGEIGPLGPVPQIPQETSAHVPEPKHLAPLYWQVYNKVATEHCSAPARFLYNLSKTTIAPWNQDMSTPEKILSVVGTPFRAIGKGIGIIGTKITGADKKFKRMKEAIDALSPEEFSVLTDTKEEAKMRGVAEKSDFDFELTSDTMRQYKHNTLALDAILSRVEQETSMTQEFSNRYISQLEQNAARIKEALANPSINATQKQVLSNELLRLNGEIEKANGVVKVQVEKRDRIANGIQHRTSKYKDTEGWVLGKFNPDNREANLVMQDFQTRYAQALAENDGEKLEAIKEKMREFTETQTRTIQVGDNVHNKISRGNFAVDGIKVQNMTPQTIGQQILANIATIGVFEHIFTNIKNQNLVDQAVSAENARHQQISGANYSATKTTTIAEEIGVDPNLAQEGMKNITTTAAHGVGEYGNLDMSALEQGGSWKSGINTANYAARDSALHQATAEQIANGDLASAMNLYKDNVNTYIDSMRQYAQTKGFDYSILNAMSTDGLDEVAKVMEALNKPITITLSGVSAGAKIADMAGVTLDKFNPATMATLVTTQAGHFVSTPSKKENKEEDFDQYLEPVEAGDTPRKPDTDGR